MSPCGAHATYGIHQMKMYPAYARLLVLQRALLTSLLMVMQLGGAHRLLVSLVPMNGSIFQIMMRHGPIRLRFPSKSLEISSTCLEPCSRNFKLQFVFFFVSVVPYNALRQ